MEQGAWSAEQELAGAMLEYESGRMSREEVLLFFQRLVDTGMAWRLGGRYSQVARELLRSGVIET